MAQCKNIVDRITARMSAVYFSVRAADVLIGLAYFESIADFKNAFPF